MKKTNFLYRTYDLYVDGFRHMTIGRTLWLVIAIKLIVIFLVLKLFFFPNYLKQHAEEGQEDSFVANEMIDRANTP